MFLHRIGVRYSVVLLTAHRHQQAFVVVHQYVMTPNVVRNHSKAVRPPNYHV